MAKEKKTKIEKRNGVTVTAWKGHPVYRWRVSYSDGGKRKSRGFKTKTGADGAQIFADVLRGDVSENGKKHEAITDDERRAVMAFREIIESLPSSLKKPSLGEVIEDYRKRADVRRKSMTVRELIDKYLVALKRRKLSDDYLYQTGKRLERFDDDHGDWMACNISTEVAGDWLHDLELAPLTVNHYRAAILQMFNFGIKTKAVEENPIVAVDKLKGTPGEVGILSPIEAADLLTHSSDEILPAIAIGLFAGLRRSEISRLDWQEIDFEQGHIEVKAKTTKSAARRLIPMRDSLRAWLSINPQPRGPVMPTEMVYRTRLDAAKEAAGIAVWPHNALRHSFASYNLAAFENAPALAGEMGHGSTKMIYEHYRALVTKAKGVNYWGIYPGSLDDVIQLQA